MVDVDEYQTQNAKNFKYRYYPPRLVELQDAHVNSGTQARSAGKSVSTRGDSGYTIWIIIIIVVVVTCFLMLGILYVDSMAPRLT